ncbi:MAG: hypothetical protein QXO86_03180 [Nitrososphaerota archaeon]
MGDIEALRRRVHVILNSMPELGEFCDRCLNTMRWGGSVVLMVVDAALTSSGLNYFTAVVPKIMQFSERFVEKGVYDSLIKLSRLDIGSALPLLRNERCWRVAREVAASLKCFGEEDREALRNWAALSDLEKWRLDPVGSLKGVGLVTYQYLRMMGGVDTVMPDRVVKRVMNRLLAEAGFQPVWRDLDFIKTVSKVAAEMGVRPVELCWMTWLHEGESTKLRSKATPSILLKI